MLKRHISKILLGVLIASAAVAFAVCIKPAMSEPQTYTTGNLEITKTGNNTTILDTATGVKTRVRVVRARKGTRSIAQVISNSEQYAILAVRETLVILDKNTGTVCYAG